MIEIEIRPPDQMGARYHYRSGENGARWVSGMKDLDFMLEGPGLTKPDI